MSNEDMYVIKRDGSKEEIAFDKILKRVKKLGTEAELSINYTSLVMKIIEQLYDGIETSKIDELTAQHCASQITTHPDFGILASYIVISNLHKNTTPSFATTMELLYEFFDNKKNKKKPLLSESFYENVVKNAKMYDDMIDYSRDYNIDYFGFKTLERAYLMSLNGVIVERPQHMFMRVAVVLHGDDLWAVKQTYDLMSHKYFTHATPTLFNAGTPRQQLSSCYLIGMEEDSIEGIYNTLKDCALISKYAGGIGLHIHNVRATGSHIHGTNGTSSGIVPMLRNFNETARYVDQGGSKRNGSFAIYLSPDHPDVEDWLDLKKNTGDENARARDLFYGLWVPDLFMERVKQNSKWSMFCPSICPDLSDLYGDEYKVKYEKYESEGKATKTVNARELWLKILDSQMETGTPYLLYKDAANKKSNQQNVGTIKSSNLCVEIIEYSDKNETAVCNLASIALSMFINLDKTFNYEKLHDITKVVTTNLNKIIDINYYPTEKTKKSNLRHRPIGIGVQGLADAFILMDIPYHSDEAKVINKNIFETIYHAAMEQSVELAKKDGKYETYEGSPLSKGKFQFDLWNCKPSDRYDWDKLKKSVKKHGVRNSLLLAPMPTASTSQILGNNECFEPFTSNIYTRRTLAGEFIIINKYLIRELIDLGLWNTQVKDNIILNKGSIQQIEGISEHIKNKYKIVWEMPMKHLIDMARDRGIYVCQSQSLNLWVEDPTYNILTSMHFYAWEQGLKSGIYYLRRKPRHHPQQFTIEPDKKETPCEMCSA
jgi:ribonucleoside-diphosphate reductase alpha chain